MILYVAGSLVQRTADLLLCNKGTLPMLLVHVYLVLTVVVITNDIDLLFAEMLFAGNHCQFPDIVVSGVTYKRTKILLNSYFKLDLKNID